VDLAKMAALFGIDAGVLEEACVELIGSRRLGARIDAHTKTLKATVADLRASAFEEAQAAADETLKNIRATLVRASCEVHGFAVEPPSMGRRRDEGYPGDDGDGDDDEIAFARRAAEQYSGQAVRGGGGLMGALSGLLG